MSGPMTWIVDESDMWTDIVVASSILPMGAVAAELESSDSPVKGPQFWVALLTGDLAECTA